MRTSKFVAGVGVLAVVTVVGLSAPFAQASVPPADRASGTGSAAASSACKPLTARSTRLVGADGHQVAATATTAERSKAATVHTYRLPSGLTFSMTTPPASFNPVTASVEEARAFGFPKPTDPTALAAWKAKYKGYRGMASFQAPCANSDVRWGTSYFSNWSGIVNTGHTNYDEVYDDQTIPTYSSTCPVSSSLVGHWIGLGGYKTTSLLQEGFNPEVGSNTAVDLWWQAISSTHNNPPVTIATTTSIGHTISMYMTYASGTTVFHWYDRTSGVSYSPVTVTGASGYYNGAAADYITERPGGYSLRRFSTMYFAAAGARYGGTVYTNMGALPFDTAVLTTNGSSSGAKMITTSPAPYSTAFNQTWVRCS